MTFTPQMPLWHKSGRALTSKEKFEAKLLIARIEEYNEMLEQIPSNGAGPLFQDGVVWGLLLMRARAAGALATLAGKDPPIKINPPLPHWPGEPPGDRFVPLMKHHLHQRCLLLINGRVFEDTPSSFSTSGTCVSLAAGGWYLTHELCVLEVLDRAPPRSVAAGQ